MDVDRRAKTDRRAPFYLGEYTTEQLLLIMRERLQFERVECKFLVSIGKMSKQRANGRVTDLLAVVRHFEDVLAMRDKAKPFDASAPVDESLGFSNRELP